MKMKAIHNLNVAERCVTERCVKLVKDNENESNSQRVGVMPDETERCVKLVKDNENESNSQPLKMQTCCAWRLCEAGQR